MTTLVVLNLKDNFSGLSSREELVFPLELSGSEILHLIQRMDQ